MKVRLKRRFAAVEAAMLEEVKVRAALAVVARNFPEMPREEIEAQLRAAPWWEVEALRARHEGREPSGEGLHADWKHCGCVPCTRTRFLLGPKPGSCPECYQESHLVGSRPHDAREWPYTKR